MNILIVAPAAANLQTAPEIARVASGNSPTILDGYVSRGKLQMALQTRQFDVLHFATHGDYALLQMSDGPLAVGELATMIEGQCRLKLIVLNACRSASTAAALHDAAGTPVVMYEAAADDLAAVRYAEVLYGALASDLTLHEAHDRAVDVLRKVFDLDESNLPTLLNGTMNQFANIENRLGRLEEQMRQLLQRRGLQGDIQTFLLVLLLVAIVLDVVRHWPA
jgi:hypothetical protein